MPKDSKDKASSVRHTIEYSSVLAAVLHQKAGVSVEHAVDQAVNRTIEAIEDALKAE